MKKINTLVLLKSSVMIAAITLTLFTNHSFGQCFRDSYYSENSSLSCTSPMQPGVTGVNNITHTGNDSRARLIGSANPVNMEVNVWDGDSPGLSWNDGTHQCNIALNDYAAFDPDVALVESYDRTINQPPNDQVTWFAVVVYKGGDGHCYMDLYAWKISTAEFAFYSSTELLKPDSSNSDYSTAINIDADEVGNFCIVWDDQASKIIAVGGSGYSTTPPTICTQPSTEIISGSAYSMPDVSLTKRGCSGGSCFSRVYFTYVDNSSSQSVLQVQGDDFEDWICGGFTLHHSHASFYPVSLYSRYAQYLFPRIACPRYSSSGCSGEWTVVTELYDPGNPYGFLDDIVGYTNNDCMSATFSNYYTNGNATTPSPCAIDNTSERNQFPVVSYDYNHHGMMVGWQSAFTDTDSVFTPNATIGLIALQCNADNGGVNTNGCTPNLYKVIPYDNSTATSDEIALSLSGRDHADSTIQYTFYDENIPDVLYKNDAWGSCSLRLKNPEVQSKDISVFPNPFTDNLTIALNSPNEFVTAVICDITGKILIEVSGNESQLNNSLNKLSSKLSSGVYLLRIYDDNSGFYNVKLIKI